MTALEFLLPNLHEEESLGERYGLLDLCCGTGTFALCAAALLRKKGTKFRKFFSRQASLLLPYHPHRPASLRSFSSSSSFDMDAGALRKRKKRERERKRKRDEEEDEERENREDDSEDSSSDEEEEEGEEGGPLERSKEEEKKEEERSKERKKKRGEGGDESKEKEEKEKENKEEGGRRPRIVGIEVVEEAIHHARLNAERNGLSQDVRFICEAVLPDLLASAEFNTSFQKLAAIVDPPRSGLHSRTLDALINFKPLKRLVYVSCNAASMVSNCIR
ncbi:trna (uracil-5-)-methyltransferase [Cystoisospora suis]|uniref:Trna (Uracil-5-)-methyltransferase n=1 Tax=Cystoisospora suis TaxID=483139 RepID=A0A2C6KLA7_9APIC|nr:trna (uracil-5-)-methyltransferase [Cystoisospora suis]